MARRLKYFVICASILFGLGVIGASAFSWSGIYNVSAVEQHTKPVFWIIEASDLDVALKLAAAGSKACNRRVEVRPFL